jgi:hypothetical protein
VPAAPYARTAQIADEPDVLETVFALELMRARQVRERHQRQRGHKIYSLHAPEVECIGKGKAQRPYELGVKVSVVTPPASRDSCRNRKRGTACAKKIITENP